MHTLPPSFIHRPLPSFGMPHLLPSFIGGLIHLFHSPFLSAHSQVTSLLIYASYSSFIRMLLPSSTDYFIRLPSTSFINSQGTFFIYYTPLSFIQRSPHSFISFMSYLLHSHMRSSLHLFMLHFLHFFFPSLPLSLIYHLLHSLSSHLLCLFILCLPHSFTSYLLH